MSIRLMTAALTAAALPGLSVAQERGPLFFWGIQAEQVETRWSGDDPILAWDVDAFAGTDKLKLVWRSEAEYATGEDAFETLENQIRLQRPISDFWDVVAGVRLDTPEGEDRVYGVVGLHGLAPQWFEIDADFFVSAEGDPSLRFEAEYEGLITQRIILTPSVEIDLPFTDDEDVGVGAFAPVIELGARLSYDLIDRAVAPYVGVHYEQPFGETKRLRDEDGTVYGVAGVRLMF